MLASVNLETVYPRTLAAVRCAVTPRVVDAAWGRAFAKVRPFNRNHPGLWTGGHNIFLYRHPGHADNPILCDFGVEVTRAFKTVGYVCAAETPAGEAAVAVHRGPYNHMREAHAAIQRWMGANGRESAGHSWEIYGNPTPDPSDTATTIFYLLK